jgi:hypothetical protein
LEKRAQNLEFLRKVDMDKMTLSRNIWRYRLGNPQQFRMFCGEIYAKIDAAKISSFLSGKEKIKTQTVLRFIRWRERAEIRGDNRGALALRRYKRFDSDVAEREGLMTAEVFLWAGHKVTVF